jgi:hypothetical protein
MFLGMESISSFREVLYLAQQRLLYILKMEKRGLHRIISLLQVLGGVYLQYPTNPISSVSDLPQPPDDAPVAVSH